MRAFSIRSAVVLLALLAGGCDESPAAPSPAGGSAATQQLAGSWALVSVQVAGQPEQAPPPGLRYSVTFGDGRLSAQANCNTCVGVFSLSGVTLTAGPELACTRVACGTMAFEQTYTNLLSRESTIAISGSTLVLTSSRGVLRFSREP